MSTLALVILVAMLLFIIIGAAKLAFWLIIAFIAYLVLCTIIESIQSWLKPRL